MRKKLNLGDGRWALILGGLLILFIARCSHAETLSDCIRREQAAGAVIGHATFVGEPWIYTWTLTKEWNNAAGKMVDINPVEHILPVPGEQLQIEFEDKSSFTYGEVLTDGNRVQWADNLGSLARVARNSSQPNYTAVKRADGSMSVIFINEDGSCNSGWPIHDLHYE